MKEVPELPNNNQLAVGRTVLALDRTLMAWVRTALSLISFGFTIYKFLQSIEKDVAAAALRPSGPRSLGLFLIVMGTGPLILAIVQFCLAMRRKLGVSLARLLLNPSLILAAAIAILGLVLFISLVTHWEVI